MISSMTGFGRGEVRWNEIEAAVEVQSVNYRYLDITLRLPRAIVQYESEVKNIVKKHISRGRINVVITLNKGTSENKYSGLKTNEELVQTYWKLLKKLKKQLKVRGKLRLEHLLNFPDIIIQEDESEAARDVWERVEKALEMALQQLKAMRRQEGQQLYQDLAHRIQILEDYIATIEKISQERTPMEIERLREKVKALIHDNSVDETRLEQEVALLATRVDVTEECTRFKSHNKLFLDTLKADEAVGRRLNFLLQEMNREVNTIGAKANDAQISHLVVTIKEEVEKIREQVQNIE